eukprot:29412-Pelagococcus_subviridis.AAC.6
MIASDADAAPRQSRVAVAATRDANAFKRSRAVGRSGAGPVAYDDDAGENRPSASYALSKSAATNSRGPGPGGDAADGFFPLRFSPLRDAPPPPSPPPLPTSPPARASTQKTAKSASNSSAAGCSVAVGNPDAADVPVFAAVFECNAFILSDSIFALVTFACRATNASRHHGSSRATFASSIVS